MESLNLTGIALLNLKHMVAAWINLCLLAAWINRYHLNDSVIWKKIVSYKYNSSPNIFCCPEISASPFWKGVLWAYKAAQVGIKWKIGDGKTVKFWEDW